LPEPHAKYVVDDVFELRVRGQEGHIRILYFFYYRQEIVFTNGFIKKTDKIPIKEIQLAKQRKQRFLER